MILLQTDLSDPKFFLLNLAVVAVAVLLAAWFCDWTFDWRKSFIDHFNAIVPPPTSTKSTHRNRMVILQAIGHLGKDAIVNNVNGKNVINFSVAHSTKHKNAEGVEVNYTFWIECAYWTDRLKLADFLKSGTQVFVMGTPSVETYKNNQGFHVAKQRLRVNEVQLLGAKKESDSPAANSDQPSGSDKDDLPFS